MHAGAALQRHKVTVVHKNAVAKFDTTELHLLATLFHMIKWWHHQLP
jgi:hypothetical protein